MKKYITPEKELIWLKIVNWAQKNRIKVEEISTHQVLDALNKFKHASIMPR